MSQFISLRPADYDPDITKLRNVGELVINTVNGDLYTIIMDTVANEKRLVLVGGASKYEILNHIRRQNLVGKIKPNDFDDGSTWYKTDMIYAEPVGGTKDAYIMVRNNENPDPSNPDNWTKIMPYTKTSNVIVSKDTTGRITTLDQIIDNLNVVKPNIDVADPVLGELYIKDDNKIYFKGKDGVERLLANATNFSRELLVKSIHISNNPPANFDKDTLWLSGMISDDADISLASTTYAYTPEGTSTYGLKFIQDSSNAIQSGAVISNEGKVITIDNNAHNGIGYTWLNYPIVREKDVYFEIEVKDNQDLFSLLIINDGLTATNISDPGDDNNIIKIDGKGYKVGNQLTPHPFVFNNKTFYGKITAPRVGNVLFEYGYVDDHGVLQKIADGINITNKVRLAVRSEKTTTPNSKTVLTINTFKVVDLPTNYVGINNTLPTEAPFNVKAIATNAQSIFLSKGKTLSNHVHNGRLAIALKSYDDAVDAVAGELLMDYNKAILYAKMLDGSIQVLKGKYEEVFLNHVINGFGLTTQLASSLKIFAEDKTISYVTTNVPFSIMDDNNEIIVGNLAKVDTLNGGTRYKTIIPKTKTDFVYHTWNDILSGQQKSGDLKTYLTNIDNVISTIRGEKYIYSDYTEFMTLEEFNSRYNTQVGFFRETLFTNRMRNGSILMQTVLANTSGINGIFKAPENGTLLYFKNGNKKGTLILFGESGVSYTSAVKSNYELTPWATNVVTVNNITNVTGNVNITEDLSAKNATYTNNLVKGNTTYNGALGFGIKYDNSMNVVGTTTNVLGLSGSNTNRNLNISVGSSAIDNVSISAKARPVVNDGTPSTDGGNQIVLKNDLLTHFIFRGELNTSNNWLNLNTLINKNNVGYYTSPDIFPTNTNGYPANSIEGGTLLVISQKVAGTDTIQQVIIPNYTNNNGKKFAVYSRHRLASGAWQDWQRTASLEDIDLKFNKAGGIITGNTEITADLTVGGNLLANRGITIPTSSFNINASTTSATGNTVFPIQKMVADGSTNFNYNIGDLDRITTVGVYSNDRPIWVSKVKTFSDRLDASEYIEQIAMLRDVDSVSNKLNNDYYNKTKIDEMFRTGTEKSWVTAELAKKLNIAGGTMTGGIVFNTSNTGLTLNSDTKIEFKGEGLLKLPNKIHDSLTAVEAYDFSKRTMYDFVNHNNVKHGLFTVGNMANNSSDIRTTDVTSAQFLVEPNGDLQYRPIIGGNTSKLPFKKLLYTDVIMNKTGFFKTGFNNVDGNDNKVITAGVAKEIYNGLVSEFRGNLRNFITSTSLDIPGMMNLLPGYYVLHNDNTTDADRIGLDLNITTLPGVLVVSSDNNDKTHNMKFMRYVPLAKHRNNDFTDYAIGEWASVNNDTVNSSKWSYYRDTRSFYTKKEIDQLLNDIRVSVLNRLISADYKVTGNQTGHMSEKLIHTHNHPNNSNTPIFFKTNIDFTNFGNFVSFKLRLNGETTTGDIDITFIGVRTSDSNGSHSTLSTNIVYNKAVGSEIEAGMGILGNGEVWFWIKNNPTNANLSFDTYARASRMAKIGEIKVLEYTETDPGNIISQRT